MIELKPCPFCGGAVTIAITGNSRLGRRWFVTRGTQKKTGCSCRAFMESELFYEDNKEEKEAARQELIEAWNRRAE